MAQPKEKPPRDFIPVRDEREYKSLLKQGSRSHASAIIWSENQKHVLNTHLTIFSEWDKKLYAWLPPADMDPKKFVTYILKSKKKDTFFSVSLSRANVFFRTECLGVDDGGLVFKLPKQIFKVQRRKDFRLVIPPGYTTKVSFHDPIVADLKVTKKIIDLSAGGLAFYVSEEEKNFYPKGTELEDVTLKIKGKNIKTQMVVRHIQEFKDHVKGGAKIGAQFKDLSPGDAQAIASHVFDESRKIYSKFM